MIVREKWNTRGQNVHPEDLLWSYDTSVPTGKYRPGSNFFGKTPLFFRYSGVNAANAVNLQAKRR